MSLIIKKSDLEVHTGTEYVERLLDTDDDDKVCEFMDKNPKQFDLIDKITACDVAYFALRRCAGDGYCGSNSDTIITIRRKFINDYEKKFGEWIDFNKDVDY